MTRIEPRTATAAIAVTLGVGTLSKHLGLGPVPPGLIHLFGPVAEAVARFVAENLRRAVIVILVLLSPIWGAAALSAASAMPVIEEHLELPNAGITILAPAAVFLWAVRRTGHSAALPAARRTSSMRRDIDGSWVALATVLTKRGRGARAARLDVRGVSHNSA